MGRRIGGPGVAAAATHRRGRLLLPALATCAMLATTLGLGAWQVQRLHWKSALLAEIDAAERSPPTALPTDPVPFRRVAVHGRFLPVSGRYGTDVRTVADGTAAMGSQVVGVLARDGGPPVLVLRGWAPATVRTPAPDGPVDVVGYVRPPDHAGMLSLRDDPSAHVFYTLDPQAIGAGLGLNQVAPFTLVALGQPQPPGTYPQPALALPRPPNDHLAYAVTWFGLSAALAVIFVVYVRQTTMQSSAPRPPRPPRRARS